MGCVGPQSLGRAPCCSPPTQHLGWQHQHGLKQAPGGGGGGTFPHFSAVQSSGFVHSSSSGSDAAHNKATIAVEPLASLCQDVFPHAVASSDLLGVARGDVSLWFANCCHLTAPRCRPHEPHGKGGSPEEAAQGAPEHQPTGQSPTRAGLPVSLLSRDTMRGTRVHVRQPCGISWLARFVEQL